LRSGQTQQTVNLSAQAFGGSNPPLPTKTLRIFLRVFLFKYGSKF
jgi:hypothetical protein